MSAHPHIASARPGAARPRHGRSMAVSWCVAAALTLLSVAASVPWAPSEVCAQGATGVGVLYGVVFVTAEQGAGPLSGVTVRVAGDAAVTNDDGAFRLSLPPGAHQVEVEHQGKRSVSAVMVFGGEETQLLLTLSPDGALVHADIAAPSRGQEVAAPVADEGAEASWGTIEGRVVNAEGGQPIAEARVVVRGQRANDVTDEEGRFTLRLSPGEVDLTSIHPRYSALVTPGVSVVADEVREVTLEMTPAGVVMDDFVVVAPRIEGSALDVIEERRNASAVNDIIGADQIARSGDSDAASALRRVTGVNVIGGRYVYVRGLGDRYSVTLLDGAALPSPEPERRVVPLDLFPASVLEAILIQKTWTPDLPGEFGGGVVMLRTRASPASFQGSLGASVGWRVNTTMVESLREPAGRLDWLGFDAGTRALPDEVAAASDREPLNETDRFGSRGYTAEELERFGESMRNVWSPRRWRAAPNLGFSLEVGDFGELFGMPSGYVFALGYSNDWARRGDEVFRVFDLNGERQELQNDYLFETLTNTITLNSFVSTGLDFSARHKLRWTFFANRISDNEARNYQGLNRDVQAVIDVTRLRWVERTLASQQLRGEHFFGGPSAQDHAVALSWRYAYALALRLEPDRREVRFDVEDEATGRKLLSDRPEGNQRLFSDLIDQNHNLGVDVSFPVSWLGQAGAIKAGASLLYKEREVDTRRFKFLSKGAAAGDTDILALAPEAIFTPENIGNDGFQFEEITRTTDNYSASLMVLGVYAMAELRPVEALNLVGGARLEVGDQTVSTFELFNPNSVPVEASLENLDVLPSLSASWDFSETLKLRGAVARTVSRPDFRELSPATFNDVTGGRQVFGNPELARATILHEDLRLEWYPNPGESVSVSVFAKQFQDPIEKTVEVSAQQTITFANARSASNLGFELEVQKGLAFIHTALRDWYVSGNATLVMSEVDLTGSEGIQTSSRRALQGQAPYVFNVQFGYDNPDSGTRAAALYNVTGAYIDDVGALGAADIYVEPTPALDVVASQQLGGGFKLTFKARNLLDPAVRKTQAGTVVNSFRRGRDFSLSATWGF